MTESTTPFGQGPHFEIWRDMAKRVAAAYAASAESIASDAKPRRELQIDFDRTVLVQPLQVNDEPFGAPMTGIAESALGKRSVHFLVNQPLETRFVRLDDVHSPPRKDALILDVFECVEADANVFLAHGMILYVLSSEASAAEPGADAKTAPVDPDTTTPCVAPDTITQSWWVRLRKFWMS